MVRNVSEDEEGKDEEAGATGEGEGPASGGRAEGADGPGRAMAARGGGGEEGSGDPSGHEKEGEKQASEGGTEEEREEGGKDAGEGGANKAEEGGGADEAALSYDGLKLPEIVGHEPAKPPEGHLDLEAMAVLAERLAEREAEKAGTIPCLTYDPTVEVEVANKELVHNTHFGRWVGRFESSVTTHYDAEAVVDAKTGEVLAFETGKAFEFMDEPKLDEAALESQLRAIAEHLFAIPAKEAAYDRMLVLPSPTGKGTLRELRWKHLVEGSTGERLPMEGDYIVVVFNPLTFKVVRYVKRWFAG